MKTPPLLALSALLLATGCVPPTTIVSKKADTANPVRKRIMVRSNLENPRAGASFGPRFAEAFHRRMGELLKACGAEVRVSSVTGLEMNGEQEFVAALTAFKPDTIMTIVKTHGVVPAGGGTMLIRATYSMDVFQPEIGPDKKARLEPIWRSTVDFARGDGMIPLDLRGTAVAEDVTNRMKQDGFFPGCPVFVAPKERYEEAPTSK